MKKITYLEITMLFLLILAASSILIISLKSEYLAYKEENMIEKVMNVLEESNTQEADKEKIFENGEIGLIIIPSIEVEAPIYEGTSSDVLKYSVRTF